MKPATPSRSLIVPDELVPERAGTVAFIGSQSRKGDWLLPRVFRVVAFMGNVEVKVVDPDAPGLMERLASRLKGK